MKNRKKPVFSGRNRMSEMRILVTGSDGQLGKAFREVFANENSFEVHFATKAVFDITNFASMQSVVSAFNPHVVINCAAYTNVELAESESDLANEVNGYAVGKLAEICNSQGIYFVHFSTDYVFDGAQTKPYCEDALTAPLNAYGKSKLLGEELALSVNPGSLIVRISWLFSLHGKNFLNTMRKLFDQGTEVRVVDDQVASPTYALVLASDIVSWMKRDATFGGGGLMHYSHNGITSWFGFAQEIKDCLASDVVLIATTTNSFKSAVTRPKFSKLENARFHEASGLQMISWQEAVSLCLKNI
jgi:dTDP-4-dehydrorhamnose reductase